MPFPWEMPVGIPAEGSIQINLVGTSPWASRTVTIYPFCLNAFEMAFWETGGYEAAEWIDYARTASYTFDSDGAKTLYAAFRNPARFTHPENPAAEDETAITVNVTIDTDYSNGLIDQIKTNIVSILRADTTLQAYATGDQTWNSTTDPHVFPGWRAEDPSLSASGNRGRMPFVEVRAGPCPVTDHGAHFQLDAVFQIRVYLEVNQDVEQAGRESDMNKLLWDVWEALNAYPELGGISNVERSGPVSLDPTAGEGDSYRVGQLDYAVRAGIALQDRS
jgi:hypothetical protein